MFFVGIFGMNAKHEQAGYLSARCPVCGCEDPLHVIRRYNYIHFSYSCHSFRNILSCDVPAVRQRVRVPKDIGDEARRTGTPRRSAVLTLIENNAAKRAAVRRAFG
jgi:hypothetical protein